MSGDRMVTILTVDFDCVLCLVTVDFDGGILRLVSEQ